MEQQQCHSAQVLEVDNRLVGGSELLLQLEVLVVPSWAAGWQRELCLGVESRGEDCNLICE